MVVRGFVSGIVVPNSTGSYSLVGTVTPTKVRSKLEIRTSPVGPFASSVIRHRFTSESCVNSGIPQTKVPGIHAQIVTKKSEGSSSSISSWSFAVTPTVEVNPPVVRSNSTLPMVFATETGEMVPIKSNLDVTTVQNVTSPEDSRLLVSISRSYVYIDELPMTKFSLVSMTSPEAPC